MKDKPPRKIQKKNIFVHANQQFFLWRENMVWFRNNLTLYFIPWRQMNILLVFFLRIAIKIKHFVIFASKFFRKKIFTNVVAAGLEALIESTFTSSLGIVIFVCVFILLHSMHAHKQHVIVFTLFSLYIDTCIHM